MRSGEVPRRALPSGYDACPNGCDVQFAASAWGKMLEATCFDETLVAQFITDHYNAGPEDVCGGGIDPLDPAEMIPADCGE